MEPHLLRAVEQSYSGFAVLEVRGDQARVQAVPDPARLVSALGEFGLEWAVGDPVIAGGHTVTATLTLGGQRRGGLGRGHTLRDAQALALADALHYFGLPLPEPQWVEYDEEEGANTLELQAGVAAPGALTPLPRAAAAAVPDGDEGDSDEDPQMARARQIIDELMEELRTTGQGAKAAALITRHGGYGATIDERRAVYRELSRLRDGE